MAKEKMPRPPVWLVLGTIYGAFLGFAAIILRTGGYDWSFYGAEALIITVVGAFIGLIVGTLQPGRGSSVPHRA